MGFASRNDEDAPRISEAFFSLTMIRRDLWRLVVFSVF
jgi:hypothetical protein